MKRKKNITAISIDLTANNVSKKAIIPSIFFTHFSLLLIINRFKLLKLFIFILGIEQIIKTLTNIPIPEIQINKLVKNKFQANLSTKSTKSAQNRSITRFKIDEFKKVSFH